MGKVSPLKHDPISFFLPNYCYFLHLRWELEAVGQCTTKKQPSLLKWIFLWLLVLLQQYEIESSQRNFDLEKHKDMFLLDK